MVVELSVRIFNNGYVGMWGNLWGHAAWLLKKLYGVQF